MMFYGTFYEIFCFLVITLVGFCAKGNSSLVGSDDEGPDNRYRACLNSFNIHKNKIIRTQDSQEMGAKYLNEVDVSGRDECLKLCCKTDGCDVFIFEEKEPGSCYLFHCGPLHDFKCKFTSHVNYTSAVQMTYSGQEEELRVSQQEHELKSLRKMTDGGSQYPALTVTPVKTILTEKPKLVATTPLPIKRAGCSRNQYECRSSGECIAIYNVCDGIPQCTDGSDEAAELVCPTEKPTIAPPLLAQHPIPQLSTDVMKYQQLLNQRKSIPPLYSREIEGNHPHPWELTNPVHQIIPQPQNLMYPAQQIQIPQFHPNLPPQDYHWDYQPLYERNKANYKIPAAYQDPSSVNSFDREQPPILPHQEAVAVKSSQLNEPNVVYTNPDNSAHLTLQNVAWQKNQLPPQQPTIVAPSTQEEKSNLSLENIKTTSTTLCDDNQLSKPKDSQVPRIKVNSSPADEKALSHELKDKSPVRNSKEAHVQSNSSKGHENKLTNNADHAREEHHTATIVEHLRQVNDEDNLRPKGAVVSLALGLTVTAITAALIACRLRVVRRRSRRGHGPYAHDADYLVNGMYL